MPRDDDYAERPGTPRPSRLVRIRSHRMFWPILIASIIVAVGVLGTVAYFVTESYWDRQAMLADLRDPDPKKRSEAALNIEHLARNASAKTRVAIVNEVAKLLADPDPGVRYSALNGLSQFRNDARSVWEQAVLLLKDPEPYVRKEAIRFLFTLRPTSAEDATVVRGLRSPVASDRWNAIVHLLSMGSNGAYRFEYVLPLCDDPDPDVRTVACGFVIKTGDSDHDPVPFLLELLRKYEKEPQRQNEIIRSLGDAQTLATPALPALKQLEGDPQVGLEARKAIVEIERSSNLRGQRR